MIHHLNPNDLPDLVTLSQEAGWDHTLADWQTLLKCGAAFGQRDESGKAISSCVLTRFESRLVALGMLIVASKYRHLGLGSELMRHAVSPENSHHLPIFLCSASPAEKFYERFGFRTVEQQSKLRAPAGVRVPDSGHSSKVDVRAMDEAALSRVLSLDAQVSEYDRGGLIRERFHQAEQRVLLHKSGTETLLGYGFGVLQGDQMLIGPVLAFNRFSAQEIVRAILEHHNGPVRMDTYHQRQDFTEELLKAGFVEVERQPVMLNGANALPGRRDHLFALMAQAWG